METRIPQETPLILACYNIDYLRYDNVKFNDQSLIVRDQKSGILDLE